MKRTKTPEQISNQCNTLMHRTALKHWDGKQYQDHAQMMSKLDFIRSTAWRYIDNIYNINGMDKKGQQTQTAKSNEIWHNAATPCEIYSAK